MVALTNSSISSAPRSLFISSTDIWLKNLTQTNEESQSANIQTTRASHQSKCTTTCSILILTRAVFLIAELANWEKTLKQKLKKQTQHVFKSRGAKVGKSGSVALTKSFRLPSWMRWSPSCSPKVGSEVSLGLLDIANAIAAVLKNNHCDWKKKLRVPVGALRVFGGSEKINTTSKWTGKAHQSQAARITTSFNHQGRLKVQLQLAPSIDSLPP